MRYAIIIASLVTLLFVSGCIPNTCEVIYGRHAPECFIAW